MRALGDIVGVYIAFPAIPERIWHQFPRRICLMFVFLAYAGAPFCDIDGTLKQPVE